MPDPTPSKNQLRADLRARRRALSDAQQGCAARALISWVSKLPGWPEARCIALYQAADGEIDTGPLAAVARTMGKQLFLPVMQADKHLSFVAWHREDSLCRNPLGIPEPPLHNRHCATGALDIIFMPLVGWDRQGGRLGMGGGYYDRTLSGVGDGPLLVGLAHSCQETDRVTRQAWDIPLDFVATDTGLHNCCDLQIPGKASPG